jgi:hypothetical protein
MKTRILAVAVAALVVAIMAPIALASKVKMSGDIGGGGTISFKYIKNSSVDRRVGGLKLASVPMVCHGQDAGLLTLTISGQAPIDSKRKFKVVGTGNGGLSHSKVIGRFNRSFKRAEGTMRLYGTFDAGAGLYNCDSETEKWIARR